MRHTKRCASEAVEKLRFPNSLSLETTQERVAWAMLPEFMNLQSKFD